MLKLLALPLLALPLLFPTHAPPLGHFKIYEDGSWVRYDSHEVIDAGCLPFGLCNAP